MAGDLPSAAWQRQPPRFLVSCPASQGGKYVEHTPPDASFTTDLAGLWNLESKSFARWDLCLLSWKAGWV